MKITTTTSNNSKNTRSSSTSQPNSPSLSEMSSHFHEPIRVAAEKMSISLTQLRSLCREHGLLRWPFKTKNSYDQRANSFDFAVTSYELVHHSQHQGCTPDVASPASTPSSPYDTMPKQTVHSNASSTSTRVSKPLKMRKSQHRAAPQKKIIARAAMLHKESTSPMLESKTQAVFYPSGNNHPVVVAATTVSTTPELLHMSNSHLVYDSRNFSSIETPFFLPSIKDLFAAFLWRQNIVIHTVKDLINCLYGCFLFSNCYLLGVLCKPDWQGDCKRTLVDEQWIKSGTLHKWVKLFTIVALGTLVLCTCFLVLDHARSIVSRLYLQRSLAYNHNLNNRHSQILIYDLQVLMLDKLFV